jgi:hypothetical protein
LNNVAASQEQWEHISTPEQGALDDDAWGVFWAIGLNARKHAWMHQHNDQTRVWAMH